MEHLLSNKERKMIRKKQNNTIKVTKKDCNSNQEISMENYLTKK